MAAGHEQGSQTERDALVDAAVEEFLALRRAGRPEPVERFVERYPDLAAELGEVLPALEGLASLESSASAPGSATPFEPTSAGTLPRLGGYRLLGEIGRGGMGIVYEAEEETLGRRVALKVLTRNAQLDPRRLDRFRREAQAAAKLHHTNIVPVFGFQEHDGVCFYTMQRIAGRGLDRILAERRASDVGASEARPLLSVEDESSPDVIALRTASASSSRTLYPAYFRDVALLGVQVAEALDYAHRRGVVHRDIKPSNLLVDPAGVVWITDFGLAKTEGGDGLTQTGELVGTCRYMAPEAFEGGGDAQSDVYGLGVTLYEAATLAPAFDDVNRTRLIRKICERPPVRPRKLDPHIPRDLETIILKAIEKRPSDRYDSARALAGDLRRFLSGVPPRARKTTAVEALWRWCRRNPGAAASTLTIAVLLATIAVVSSVAWVETRASLREAHLNGGRLARSSQRAGQRWMALDAIAKAAAIRGDLTLRNEAIAAAHLVDIRFTNERLDLGRSAHALTFDASLERAAFVDQVDKAAVVRSLADGRTLLSDGDFRGLDRVALDPGGALVATLARTGVRVWDVDTAAKLFERREQVNVATGTLSRDRRLSYCSGSELVVVDLSAGGEPVERRIDLGERTPWGTKDARAFIAPDGSKVAVIFHRTPDAAVVDLESGGAVPLRQSDHVFGAAWHPQSELVLTAVFRGEGSRIILWSPESGAALGVLEDPKQVLDTFSFQPAADLLVACGWEGIFRIWQLDTLDEILSGRGRPVLFSSDRARLITVEGSSVLPHDLLVPDCHRWLRAPGRTMPVRASAFHPTAPLLVTGFDGMAFWDARDGRLLARVEPDEDAPMTRCLAFFRDGTGLVTAGDHGVAVWPVAKARADDRVEISIGPPRRVSPLRLNYACVSADEKQVLATSGGAASRLLQGIDLESGEVTWRWGPFPNVDRIARSPDGRWLACGVWGFSDRTLRVLDLRSGESRELDFGANAAAAFSPDSRTMVVGADEGYSIVETGTWTVRRRLAIVDGREAAFSADGRVVACRARTADVVLVDAASGQELATLAPADTEPSRVPEFSADGRFLSAGSRVWDLARLRALLRGMRLDWQRAPLPPPRDDDALPLSLRLVEPAD